MMCRSTTIIAKTKSGPGLWVAVHGCSRAASWRANAPAVVMSLVQSAKLCGHDPYAYLKDVLERLPTHMASRIDDLLPHRWQPLR